MRGGLDETLARMARREEALRRRAADAGAPGGRADAPPGKPAEPVPTGARGEGRNAGPGWVDNRRDRQPHDLVTEVTEAVRRVVAGHPGTAVSIRVEHDGQAYPLRVAWTATGVTVGAAAATGGTVGAEGAAGVPADAEGATPPPTWPMSDRTVPAWTAARDGLAPDPAARLAELIRRDPALLSEGDPPH
ncbi:hypothetical protein [Micromonospora sp. NPDC047074]|uniref:hypothetical protein n=1 Tax=Micromonospora sp. NPDC047074 TaxID=3154339 RepID=UPI0033D65AD3